MTATKPYDFETHYRLGRPAYDVFVGAWRIGVALKWARDKWYAYTPGQSVDGYLSAPLNSHPFKTRDEAASALLNWAELK